MNPLQEIFDYFPMVLYKMVDSVQKKSKLLYDFELFIFTYYDVEVNVIAI